MTAGAGSPKRSSEGPPAPASTGTRPSGGWQIRIPGWVRAWCLIWLAGPVSAWAAALLEGPNVEAGTDGATISWATDVPTAARVRYGLHPNRLDQRAEGPVAARHAIRVEGLRAGTTYHYTVGSARGALATNSFVTTGRSGWKASEAGRSPSPVLGEDGSARGAGGGVGSPAARAQAPPSRTSWGSPKTLADHFARHGRDFGARDAEDYARQAWEFRQRAIREGLPAKRDSDGVVRVYDPRTRAFAAYNRDGTTRTYFKPGRRDYFNDQPGRTIDLKREER